MRIVHMTSVHLWYDMRIFMKMCRSLAACGHEVHLIAPCKESQGESLREGVHIHRVEFAEGRRTRFLKTTKRVWALASSIPADVYHFHDPELLVRAVRFQHRLGKPVVYDAHEDVRGAIFDKIWIPKLLRRNLSLLTGSVEDWASRRLAGVVAATPAIARRFAGHPRHVVINNYPLFEEFEPENTEPVATPPPRFTYVGGITGIRGPREMIQALALVGDDIRLAMAGEWLNSELRNECMSLPGASRVEERGFLDRSEIRMLFRSSRAGLVLFHPARNHIQAQPNKMFEYMSAGLPVIASDFPLWRSIIEEAGCGLLVDPMDPEAIAGAMRWIIEHPEQARAMGQKGRAAVTARYNWEREFPKLLRLYERLVSGRCGEGEREVGAAA